MKTDVLIIGSGVAGLSLALKFALGRPDLEITLVTKNTFQDSSSYLAQGGVAAVMDSDKDSIQKHIKDTLVAGDGLCDKKVVRDVVTQGPDRINELIDWGWKADFGNSKQLDLVMEGGHSARRVVHYKDQSGPSIIDLLLAQIEDKENIKMIENTFSIDLIMEKKKCFGSLFFNSITSQYFSILAQQTVLATGGSGQVYSVSTNPSVATGDGVAIGSRAGAQISHMEFVQFHPTALFIPDQKGRAFLISEAIRGHGAKLKHKDGKKFMFNHDKRGSLAPRDIVARAIAYELKDNHLDHVYLDCRDFDEGDFILRFPNIYNQCIERGIDPLKEMIPVAPAAHYMCGGIVTDKNAESNIENLFAIGECAHTGMHGANRLASNSLLEALAYAHNCYNYLKDMEAGKVIVSKDARVISFKVNKYPFNFEEIKEEMQHTMTSVAGIVRSELDLRVANLTLTGLELDLMICTPEKSQLLDYYELRNAIMVSQIILGHSMSRKENYGGFYKIENVSKKH